MVLKLLNNIKQYIWINDNVKSKFCKFIDSAIIMLFLLCFFSIPTFSFIGSGKYVTWVLTLLLMFFIFVSMIVYRGIKIDIISISLILFAFSAFLSTALNGFKSFKPTPILLSILSSLIYTYCVSIKKKININVFLFAAFIGTVMFLGFFIAEYFGDLVSFNFSRLGNKFGDDNDIALFLAFGLTTSVYYGTRFKKKYLWANILCCVLSFAFVYCGFSTGSKIFILILLFLFIFFPFAICGKKKWWLALLIIVCLIGLVVVMINLPVFATLKSRTLSFVSTLIGKSIANEKTDELSTINRFDMFICGMQMWLRKPMFGWGIWGFATFSGRAGGWSHNNISESFCNFGLVGTILFHLGFYYGLKGYIKNIDKKRFILPFVLLCFYLISMISVALNSQKLYATIIGVILSLLAECSALFEIKPLESHLYNCKSIPTISIIGNNANNSVISDGGRIKIRLYKELLEREKYNVEIIELDGWKKHIFRLVANIYNAVNCGNTIVIMAGPKGCRFIIPLVNKLNKKHKSRVVFCALGIGTLDSVIKDLPKEKAQEFLSGDFPELSDNKMSKQLERLDKVIVENETLLEKYKKFYGIKNVEILKNFRDVTITPKKYSSTGDLRIVYFSRVKSTKGIFDLLEAVKTINDEFEHTISLDIYGDNQLTDDEFKIFESYLNERVVYRGIINSAEAIDTLKLYDLFCLPTKYYGEGTSGALIEAMIAGVPPLLSGYSQSKDLVQNHKTGLIYDFNSVESLIDTLREIIKDKSKLKRIGINAQKFASQYTYFDNRESFLDLLVGDNKLRVLIVMSGGFDTYGPSRHLYMSLIEDLLKKDIMVHLIESHSSGTYSDVPESFADNNNFTYEIVKTKIVDKKAFVKRYLTGLKYTMDCKRPLKRAKNKYDVAMIQSCVWAPFMVPLVKKTTNAITVWNIQDMFPGASIENGVLKNNFLKKCFFKLHKRAYKKADFITVISDDMKLKVIEQGYSEDKITVINDWFDDSTVKEIPWDENEFVKKYNLKKDNFYVQFAGTMGFNFDYKSVIFIAESLKDCKEIVFQMVGFGSQLDDFKKEVEEHQLKNIVFLPLQEQSLVSHVYSACSISIIPLPKGVIGNSVPSKLGLLMACRRPVISISDENSLYLKMINENGFGFGFKHDDLDLAAQSLRLLKDNPELLIKMGNKGFEFGHEIYSRTYNTDKYAKLFNDIKENHGRK